MNCYIIDDEPTAIRVLAHHISEHPKLTLIGSSNAVDAIPVIEKGEIDLVFLDIRMPEMSGLEFLQRITIRPMIIFTTAFPNYAVEAFEEGVIDYLLKPIKFPRFEKAVQKAFDSRNANNDHIFLKTETKGKFQKIEYDQVNFIKSIGNNAYINLEGFSVTVYKSLKDLGVLFPGNRFLKIHQSFIINIDKVSVVEKNFVRIKNVDDQIPIGETYRASFMDKFRGRLY